MKQTLITIALLSLLSCKKEEVKPEVPKTVTQVTVKDTVYPFIGRWLRTSTLEEGWLTGVFNDSLIITEDKIYVDINGKGIPDFYYPYTWINESEIKVTRQADSFVAKVILSKDYYRIVNDDLIWVISK